MGRARAAGGQEHHVGRRRAEQEFEAADLVAAGPRFLWHPREGAERDRRRTGAARKRRMMPTRPDAALAEVVAALRREPLVAADTEAASFHRYRDRIFLVQLSSPRQTAIIDPLAVRDLAPLGDLLADPQVEKIFHDADYDLRILDRDYGFRARRLCDTRIAAQLATLRALYRWREEVAAQADTATFRIIGNDALLAVSKALPETHEALGRVSGLPAVLGRRHGEALLAATREGLTLPEAQLPRIERTARPPKDPEIDARVERLKAARNRVAAELGLDPGVLCGRGTLEAVARAHPKDRARLAHVGELRRWQITAPGDPLPGARP